jgi:NAD+ synthase (glutamine-hydrolysing)
LFKAFVEHRVTPEEILNWYAEGCLEEKLGCRPGLVNTLFPNPKTFIEDLERWWKLYTGMGVAKRIQAPPILAVSRRAYGSDHREAQNGTHYTAGYLRLKKQLLSMQDE